MKNDSPFINLGETTQNYSKLYLSKKNPNSIILCAAAHCKAMILLLTLIQKVFFNSFSTTFLFWDYLLTF